MSYKKVILIRTYLVLDATAMLPDTSLVCLEQVQAKEETGTAMLTLSEVNGKEMSCITKIKGQKTGTHFFSSQVKFTKTRAAVLHNDYMNNFRTLSGSNYKS